MLEPYFFFKRVPELQSVYALGDGFYRTDEQGIKITPYS